MRLQQVPGVTAAGAVGALPFMQRTGIPGSFRLGGRRRMTGPVQRATIRLASEDYFRVIGVSLREGRSFTRTDDLDHDNVVIVNEALARALLATRPGRGSASRRRAVLWFTIVGVVGNFRQQLSVQPVDEIYVPMRQMPVRVDRLGAASDREPRRARADGSRRHLRHRSRPASASPAAAGPTFERRRWRRRG